MRCILGRSIETANIKFKKKLEIQEEFVPLCSSFMFDSGLRRVANAGCKQTTDLTKFGWCSGKNWWRSVNNRITELIVKLDTVRVTMKVNNNNNNNTI